MEQKLNYLENIERQLQDLVRFEENAAAELERIETAPVWQPTDYERYFLPGLRLLGINRQDGIILQNIGDLHIHTQWSDGDDLDAVLAKALDLHLDAIAITDHDEIEGALEARRRVHRDRLRIAVIPGIEVSSRDGHIGALFVTKKIPKGLTAAETVQRIHEAGGIAVAHHPYSPRWIEKILRVKLGCGDLIRSVDFDAIEVTNAVPGRGVKYNIQAIEKMREHHIPIAATGSSDAHLAAFVGKGKTYWAGNEGIVSLLHAFRFGLTTGAEAYWKTREKLLYYLHLMKAIVRNRIKNYQSVN